MMMKASYIDLTGDFGNDISQIKWAFEKMSEGEMIQEKTLAELKEALSLIEDKNFSNENIINFSKSIDSIKNSISLHLVNELNIIKETTLNILSSVPRILKDELLKSLLITSDKYSDKIREVLPDESDVYRKIHEQFFMAVKDTLKGFRLEKLSEMRDFRGLDCLQSIQYIQSTLVEEINEEVFILTIRLSEEDLHEIKQNISNKYPGIGKNNFSILRNLKKIEGDYIFHVKEQIKNQAINHAMTNFDTYDTFGDAVNDMLVFNASIFRNGLRGYYKDFVEEYLDNLFNSIQERKFSKSINTATPKKYIITDKIIASRRKICSNEVCKFIDGLLNNLDTEEKEKKIIKSYILRIYQNGKSIRIKDMIYNFPVTKDLFTEEFINQSKEVGLIFENGNGIQKEEDKLEPKTCNSNINPESEENEDTSNVEDEVKITFQKKVDWYLNNIKTFDGMEFVKIMKLAEYKIENETHVAKCFNKLYHNFQMKQIFLNDLRKNIFLQKKISLQKKYYRKIEVYSKKGHRILFLKNNKTIDGIYSHDEYENRIAVFIGG